MYMGYWQTDETSSGSFDNLAVVVLQFQEAFNNHIRLVIPDIAFLQPYVISHKPDALDVVFDVIAFGKEFLSL